MNGTNRQAQPRIGLVLSGGGARAAYQVGVLQAISEMLPADVPCPFQIICGTSAGAINATVLAAHSKNFHQGVRQLMAVWKNFHVRHVYRSDPLGASGHRPHAVLPGPGSSGPRRGASLLPARATSRGLYG